MTGDARVHILETIRNHSKSGLIPFPTDSEEVGRNIRDGFSQITVSSKKTAEEVHRFYRNWLYSKGWKTINNGEDLLSVIYTRDGERVEVSVLSVDGEKGTVFSITHFE